MVTNRAFHALPIDYSRGSESNFPKPETILIYKMSKAFLKTAEKVKAQQSVKKCLNFSVGLLTKPKMRRVATIEGSYSSGYSKRHKRIVSKSGK